MAKWINFIPTKLQSDPLFTKVTEFLDEINDINYERADYIVKKYERLITSGTEGTSEIEGTLDVVFAQRIINEFGFDYINEFIELTEKSAARIAFLSALLQELKGTKEGLRLLLHLIGFERAEIAEWWEEPNDPFAVPFTFRLRLVLRSDIIKETKVVTDLIRRYVYAKLNAIEFVVSTNSLYALVVGYYENEYNSEVINIGI